MNLYVRSIMLFPDFSLFSMKLDYEYYDEKNVKKRERWIKLRWKKKKNIVKKCGGKPQDP